jgi:phosphoenolpyruvate-protein kinase (PTS system EI component)
VRASDEHRRGSEERSHVDIVTTGMHLPWVARLEREAGQLGDGKRVHVSAQRDHGTGSVGRDHSHDAGKAVKGPERDAQLP